MSSAVLSKKFTAHMHLEGSWGVRQLGEHESTMDLFVGEEPGYYFIEWDIPSLDTVEGIGIWTDPDTSELIDYDGIFSLPSEAIALLEQYGIKVG